MRNNKVNDVFCVPQHEAVCVLLSCVTQPHLTLGAVPLGEDGPFAPTVAPDAVGPPMLGLPCGITLWDGIRKMSERERMQNSTTSGSFPATVVFYELTGQLELKLLDRAERCILTVALLVR